MSAPHVKGPLGASLLDATHHPDDGDAQHSWLRPLTGHWIEAARIHLLRHAALVRTTVTALRGSAPREPGASLLVDALGTIGTIGGGRLEWHATSLARQLLVDAHAAPVLSVELVLGPELGQCCGGRVELWLERLTRLDLPWLEEAERRLQHGPAGATTVLASELVDGAVSHRLLRRPFATGAPVELRRGARGCLTLLETLRRVRPPLWIFGAGHVGQSLVRLLAELALFEITWIDSRAELLPTGLPETVTAVACADPTKKVASAPPGTRFVVLTHDHALDYELCRLVLTRADCSWLGLIGSASKSARFRSRLLRQGLDRETVARLACPIGVTGISSKLPAAIAVAIAAQLLQQIDPKPVSGSTGASSSTKPQGCAGDCSSCRDEPSS